MIVTVVGGGGMRTPLLISGLIARRTQLPVDRVVLYDVDTDALAMVVGLAKAMLVRSGRPFALQTTTSATEAFAGASFVVTSIRVGGLSGRIVDEQVPLRYGVVGQETTGPGGWAMALRTIPVLVEYAAQVRRAAPDAWIINFTNPAGLITQALVAAGVSRVIGICDSPPALGRRIADHLGVREGDLTLEYLGLNHLGWVRAAKAGGVDRLPEILASDDAIRAVYGRPLFTPEEVRRLGLLPNEYLQYYYHHDEIVRRLREAPQSRGQAIAAVAARLRAAVQQAVARGADPLSAYEEAVFARRSSYMATETGQYRDLAMMGGHVAGGYAPAALDVIEALRRPEGAELIVNIANDGGIDDLAPDDVVEIPCHIGPGGLRPRRMGVLPAAVRELVLRVKAYERATIAAARGRRWADAVAALSVHPLVPSAETAAKIAEEYRRQHAPFFQYLR